MPYPLLADAILVLHFAVVVFVVAGLPAIIVGNRTGRAWANSYRWRLAHLLAIGVVALQAWLGQHCPLTVLESWLREQGGQPAYSVSFIAHWVQQILFYDAPLWVFAIVYTAFALAVAWSWWRYPPHRARRDG